MTHYRNINKELVEQVQSMRKQIKTCSDEMVHLKAELMRKHETEILFKKQCYNWAINSFAHLLQSIQPDSDILPVLEEHINSVEHLSGSSNGGRQPCTARLSDADKRSSLLAREFQRSNSVINLRRSVCSTSPIRRSINEPSYDEEEQNSQNIPTDAEEEDNQEDNNVCYRNKRTIPQTVYMHSIIFEESDEDKDEILNSENNGVESFYESVEEVSINISEKGATLSDITNALKLTSISSKQPNKMDKSVSKKMSTRRTKRAKNGKGKENSSDEYTTSKEDSDSDIRKQRNKIAQSRFSERSNNIVEESEEETLQEPRRCSNSRRKSDTNKSFPFIENHDEIINNEVTLNSTALILNDMTLRYFKEAACSTPNSRQNSLDVTPITSCETISTICTSSNRPSRHCKPNNLSEQSLKTKLRNESETELKNYRRTRSKSKSKK